MRRAIAGQRYRENINQLLRVADTKDVCQSIAIQGFKKGLQRLAEHAFQGADRRDRASIRLTIEAFHQTHIGLGITDDIAEANFLRLTRKHDTPRAAGMNAHIAVFAERLHDSNKVVLGDFVRIANLLCGDEAIRVSAEIDKHPKRIIGM